MIKVDMLTALSIKNFPDILKAREAWTLSRKHFYFVLAPSSGESNRQF